MEFPPLFYVKKSCTLQIHHQGVYINVMDDGVSVLKRCVIFDGGWTNFHDEKSLSQSSVMTDGLKAKIEANIHEDGHFKILIDCTYFMNL